jgi:hypothetical protein
MRSVNEIAYYGSLVMFELVLVLQIFSISDLNTKNIIVAMATIFAGLMVGLRMLKDEKN